MKPRRNLFLGSFLVAFSMAQAASAGTIYWDGTSASWNTIGNWSAVSNATTPDPAALPTIADDLIFNISTANGAQAITLGADQAANSLTFNNTGTTTLTGGGTARTLTLGAGGITLASGAGAVTLGDGTAANNVLLSLTSGQQTWANNSTSDFTINNTIGSFTRATGSTLTFTTPTTGRFKMSTTVLPNVNGIVGPWALYNTPGNDAAGAGYRYATNAAGTIAAYTGGTSITNGWGGTINSASTNYEMVGASSTRGVALSANTIRVTGAASNTLTLSDTNTLTVNGILVAGSGATTIGANTGGNSITIGANNNFELVLAAMAGDISVGGRIQNNGSNVSAVTIMGGIGRTVTYGGSVSNQYTGITTVNSGTLSINKTSAFAGMGGGLTINSGGTVQYAGSGTNYIADSGTVTINGGTLNIASLSDTVGAVTLRGGTITGTTGVLSGSSYAVESGTISAILGGSGALNKSTAGTVILSGANTYAGATTISAGTLSVSADSNLGSAPGSATPASLVMNGGTLAATTGFTLNSNRGIALGTTGSTGGTIDVAASQTLVYGGIAANNGGTNSLTKIGAGTLTLSGDNTYSGATIINRGTLTLDYTTVSSKIADTSVLTLAGGTLNLANGASAHNEVVASTTLNSGASSVTQTSSTSVLRMNAITRNLGSTINFGAAGIADTDNSNDATGVLGGWATVNGTDWATSAASAADTTITAYTGYTNDTWAAANNTTVTTSSAPSSGSTTNSLRFNAAGANIVTLAGTNTLTSGGILVTSNVGNNLSTITGGTLRGASGADLVVIQNNTSNGLTISSIIADNNTATGLTKSGAGLLTLSSTSNSYSGVTTINGGTLAITSDGANGAATSQLGKVPNAATPGMLVFNGGTLRTSQSSALTLASNRGIQVNEGGGTITNAVNQSLTISAIIAGTGAMTFNNTSNTMIIGGANTFSGGATLSGAALIVPTHEMAFGTGTLTLNGAQTRGTTGFDMTLVNPVIIAANTTFATVASEKSMTFTGPALLSGNRTLTVNVGGTVAGKSVTFAGNITEDVAGRSLTKAGTGNLVLSGLNSYSGATNISGGTLTVNSKGVINVGGTTTTGTSLITGNGTLLVDGGGVILRGGGSSSNTLVLGDGSGSGNITMQNGGTLIVNNGQLVVGQGSGSGNGSNSIATSTFSQTGGTTVINSTGTNYAGNYAPGSLSITGGSFTASANSFVLGTRANATLTVGGSGLATFGTFQLGHTQASAASTNIAVNLNLGGKLAVSRVTADKDANKTNTFNFDGGTLTARADSTTFFSDNTDMTAFVRSNGAVIDDGGFAITIGQNLLTHGSSTGGGLTKLGTGTLTLSGANTYTGATTISAGTLSVSADNNLGAAPLSATPASLVINGGTLAVTTGFTLNSNRGIALGTTGSTGGTIDVAASQALVYGGIVANNGGTNSLTKLGTGTLTLSGPNTYSGATTISAGTLGVSADNNLGTAPGSATPASLVINGGTLAATTGFTLNSNRGIALGSAVASTGGTIDVAATQALVYGGIVANNGGTNSLTKLGTGTLTLAGQNTYTGGTTVSAGTLVLNGDNTSAIGATSVAGTATLQLGHANALAGSALTLNSGATLNLRADADTIFTPASIANITGTATVVNFDVNQATGAGSGRTLTLGGGLTFGTNNTSHTINVTGGNGYTLALGAITASAGTGGGPFDLVLNATNAAVTTGAVTTSGYGTNLKLQGNIPITIASIIERSNGWNAVYIGTGSDSPTVTISGATTNSTRTGGQYNFFLNSGIFNVNNAGVFTNSGSSTATTFTINGGTLDNTSAAGITVSANPTQTWASDFAFTGTKDLNLGTGAVGLGANADATRTITVNGGILTVGGVISNGTHGTTPTINLTKAGAGTLTLTGANGYTGTTSIQAGNLVIGGGNNRLLAAGSVVLGDVASTGKLVLGDGTARNQTLGGLTTTGLGGSVVGGASANSTLTLNIASGTNVFDGTLGGAGTNENNLALTKDGAGTLTLTNSNTFTGNVTVTAGRLSISNSTALGTGTKNFFMQGASRILELTNSITLGSNITLNLQTNTNNGVISSSGSNEIQGAISLTGGGTSIGSDGSSTLTLSGNITANGGTGLNLYGTSANPNTVSGIIADGSSTTALSKQQGGTWVLSNANTFKGSTSVSGGTLKLTNNLALQNSALDTGFTGGGAIDLTAVNTPTIGGFTGAGNMALSTNVTSLTLNPQSGVTATYTGNLSGGTGLTITKTGTGTQILSGTNSWSGLTTVNGGELRVTSAAALSGTNVTVSSGQFVMSGGLTISGKTITTSGSGTNFLGGLQSITGTNTWAGNVVLGADLARMGARLDSTLVISGAIDDGVNTFGAVFRNENKTGTSGGGNANTITEISGVSTYGGSTTFIAGLTRLAGGDNRLPTGTVLQFGLAGANAKFDLNGRSQQVAGLAVQNNSNDGNRDWNANELTNSSGTLSTLTVNTTADQTFGLTPTNFTGSGNYTGVITGNIALVKNGSAKLTLSGNNTYTGNTTISAGTLALSSAGSISNSANLIVNSALDVTDLTAATFTLGASQTLSGYGTVEAAGKTVSIEGALRPGLGGTGDRSLTINGNVTTTAGSKISFTVTNMGAANHDQLVIGTGSSIGLNNADLEVTFDNALSFTNLDAGEGADFLAAISSNDFTSINATWFKLIDGTTSGMFANVTGNTLTAGELSYLGLSGTQYAYDAGNGQRFWVAEGSTYLVAIPEPRAALLGGLGMLMLLRRRRVA